MSLLYAELRFAWRVLRRSPGFALAALTTLALGIGATTAMFSVVSGVLIRPLPYAGADRVISLSVTRGTHEDRAFAPANYLDVERDASRLEALAGLREAVFDLAAPGQAPQRLGGAFTTRRFFEVFGAVPTAGRVYGRADEPGAGRIAVIAEGAWRRLFGGDPGLVGRTIRLNGLDYAVIGIVPASAIWPANLEVWVLADRAVPPPPLDVETDYVLQRGISYFQVVGRLRPGVTLDEARAELTTIAARLASDHPENNRARSITAAALHDVIVGDVRQALMVLLAAVGVLLLIAAGNVAHLLLARAAVRSRELAIRSALGASGRQLVRQLLVEGLLLAVLGGLLGLVLGHWSIRLLITLAPESVPRLDAVTLDWRVLAFTAAASLLSAVVFALVPAVQAARLDLVEGLKAGGRTESAGGFSLLRRSLVIGEVALASVLLVGAGLLLHSFWRLLQVDPGFIRDRVVAIDLALPESRYDTIQKQSVFYRHLIDRLATTPGMQSVAAGFPRPFGGGSGSRAPFQVEGRPETLQSERPSALLSIVSPDYFRTLGIPLLQGRDFTADDRDGHERVLVVNQAMADRYWPDGPVLDRQIDLGGKEEWWRIVGIVGNHRSRNLALEPEPTVFLPYQQFALPFLTVYVRTTLETGGVAAATRTVLRQLDPELPLDEVRDLSAVVDESASGARFRTTLIAVFAGLALVLAAIGVYGVLTYSVTQRVREFGIRLALGATPSQIVGLTLRDGLGLVATGLAIGLAVAWALARFLRSLLYEISPVDPVTFASVPVLLAVVALLACLRPAVRAARVDPMSSLRTE